MPQPLRPAACLTVRLTLPLALLAALSQPLHAQSPPGAAAPPGVPPSAGYLLPDGSLRIVGTDSLRFLLERIDTLFQRSHPGFRFTLDLKGGYVALPQLTEGVTAFSPMAREVTAVELAPYRRLVGADPLIIRVAHGSLTSQTRTAPLGVYVSRDNPIAHLTLQQLAGIFSAGSPAGDITRWGQLGLTGSWANRPIHPVGTPEDAGFGSYMVHHLLGGRPFRPGYTVLPSSVEIVQRVAQDPGAIGFCALDFATPQTRLVPVGFTSAGPFLTGTPADVTSGAYPLDRFVYFFLRVEPGQPLAPWLKDYLDLVLSPEGQAIVAAEPDGFLPLNPQELAVERRKLDSATPRSELP